MAGLDTNMLNLIKCLAKNQIQDAKTAALACLANDNTKKNEVKVEYYTKLIKNGNTTMFELPSNVQGLMTVEDMGHFLTDRGTFLDISNNILKIALYAFFFDS